MQITSGDMPMFSDLQLVYRVPRNSTELLKINTTKFQVEREPVYIVTIVNDQLVINCNDSRHSCLMLIIV